MKVVFFVRRFWPALGGVERHVQFLSHALLEQIDDLEITVVTEQHDTSLALEEVAQGVRIFRIPIDGRADLKSTIWEWMAQHEHLIKEADILHIHDVFFWHLPQFFEISGPRVFMTFHGYEPPGPPTFTQRFWHQAAELTTESNICIGGFHQKWYGVNPGVTSYGAVEALESKEDHSQNSAVDDKHRRFVFIGRLEEDTGIWSYLESIARVHRSQSSTSFSVDVIGDGPLRVQLERFILHNDLPVRLLGRKTVSTETYQKYDVSLVSGYLTILESLNAGVPVISTFHSQLKYDYLENTPFAAWITLSAPGSALDSSILSPQKLSPKAVEWARAQTWDKLAQQYLHLWSVNQ